MSIEENKAIVHRGVEEVWNKGDLSVIDELYAEDCVAHFSPSTNVTACGPEEYKQVAKVFLSAFPDLKFTIDELIAEGDKIVNRWTASGTHQGEYMGSAPTGKSFRQHGITISRFSDGKVVEERAIWDEMYALRQLGLLPPPSEQG